MSQYAAIDLSALPAPDVIETLDYEAILARMLDDAKAALAETLPDWDPTLESDLLVILIQRWAYGALGLRARVNDAARAVLLATATGADLDNIAALTNTARLTIRAADPSANPPVPAIMETDAALRRRVQLAWEGLSVAGSEGAYIYHALSADGAVRDVAVHSPTPGDVVVTILGHEGDGSVTARETIADLPVTLTGDAVPLDGTAITDLAVTGAVLDTDYRWDSMTGTITRTADSAIPGSGTVTVSYERAGVLERVEARLADDDVRPLTDRVTVQSATVIPYTVEATLWLYDGPASGPVIAAAAEALTATVTRLHTLGHDVTLSALYAALHQPGVMRVDLTSPAADLVIGPAEAAYCTDMAVGLGGRDV